MEQYHTTNGSKKLDCQNIDEGFFSKINLQNVENHPSQSLEQDDLSHQKKFWNLYWFQNKEGEVDDLI